MKVDVPVGDQQSRGDSREWHEPICIAQAQMDRAGPDVQLIPRDVLEELQAEFVFRDIVRCRR